MKVKLLGVVALLALFGMVPGDAAPLVDLGDKTYDPNTELVWLDVSATVSRSYNYVQANLLGPSQPYAGYRYATVAEVNTLFVDAGITVFSNHGADTSISALIGLLGGPTFLPAPDFFGLGGMTADEYPLDTSFVYWMELISGTDEFNDSFAGVGGTGPKAGPVPADFGGSFLVHSLRGSTAPPINEVPLPTTLPLFATGLGMMGLLAWRRKRTAAAANAGAT
jgi:hypothetical protein